MKDRIVCETLGNLANFFFVIVQNNKNMRGCHLIFPLRENQKKKNHTAESTLLWILLSMTGKSSLIVKSRDESMKDNENNLIKKYDMKVCQNLLNQKQDIHKVPLHLENNPLWVYLVSFTVSSLDIIFGWNKMSALKSIQKKSC